MPYPATLLFSLVTTLSIASSIVSATEFVRPRALTEYADIQLAQELDTDISLLNELVSQCANSNSEKPAECYCRYPQEMSAAKAAYTKVLQAQPKWKGKILFWKNPANMASRSLIMPAIEQQLQSSSGQCKTS